jgi:hypothetical protein
MATVLEECTNEEHRPAVRFYGPKDSMQRIFIKKYFMFTVGSSCRLKRFQPGGKRFADDEEVEMEVRKWLRQQSKDFYAAGFDVLVKRWDNCINVVGSIGREIFFPDSNIIYLLFISICDLFTGSPS